MGAGSFTKLALDFLQSLYFLVGLFNNYILYFLLVKKDIPLTSEILQNHLWLAFSRLE